MQNHILFSRKEELYWVLLLYQWNMDARGDCKQLSHYIREHPHSQSQWRLRGNNSVGRLSECRLIFAKQQYASIPVSRWWCQKEFAFQCLNFETKSNSFLILKAVYWCVVYAANRLDDEHKLNEKHKKSQLNKNEIKIQWTHVLEYSWFCMMFVHPSRCVMSSVCITYVHDQLYDWYIHPSIHLYTYLLFERGTRTWFLCSCNWLWIHPLQNPTLKHSPAAEGMLVEPTEFCFMFEWNIPECSEFIIYHTIVIKFFRFFGI